VVELWKTVVELWRIGENHFTITSQPHGDPDAEYPKKPKNRLSKTSKTQHLYQLFPPFSAGNAAILPQKTLAKLDTLVDLVYNKYIL